MYLVLKSDIQYSQNQAETKNPGNSQDLKIGYPEQNQAIKTGYLEQNQELKIGYQEQNQELKTGYPEQNLALKMGYPELGTTFCKNFDLENLRKISLFGKSLKYSY